MPSRTARSVALSLSAAGSSADHEGFKLYGAAVGGRIMNEAPDLLLADHLKKLKLPTVLREYEKQARQCAAENKGHVPYLSRLIEMELIDRERRMVERRIKAAKFPAPKSLDSFDFTAIPALNKTQVL